MMLDRFRGACGRVKAKIYLKSLPLTLTVHSQSAFQGVHPMGTSFATQLPRVCGFVVEWPQCRTTKVDRPPTVPH